MLQTFKMFKGFDNLEPSIFFELDTLSITRGHQFKIKRFNTSLRKNSFSHRVVNDWNGLPEDVVNADLINSFKNRLEKYCINNPIKLCPP